MCVSGAFTGSVPGGWAEIPLLSSQVSFLLVDAFPFTPLLSAQ